MLTEGYRLQQLQMQIYHSLSLFGHVCVVGEGLCMTWLSEVLPTYSQQFTSDLVACSSLQLPGGSSCEVG